MAVSVVMPALEMAQESGKLVSWLKKEGETVRKGEMLLEVETDKAVVEIEAATDGILAGITAHPGDVIPVGHTIAWLVQPGEAPPAAARQEVPTARRTDAPPVAAATVAAPVASSGEALRISPKARRLAKEHGVDLSRVKGSGPGGEILADDVLRAAQSPVGAGATAGVGPASVTGPSTETPTTVGRLMAERTTQSWTTVPHFFVTRDVDASGLKMARDAMLPAVEQSHGVKATLTDLIVLVVARTLKRHPRLNASWNGGSIVVHPDVNVGLAVAVENAVVTGVIPNTDTTPIGEIATRRRDLLQRATVGRLRPEDVSGATFTISNLGMYDVDAFTAIIVPPQAAILAVAAVVERVVAVDGTPGVRPMITLTLSCDHRVVDGVRAAEFLGDLATALRKPDVL